MLNPDFVTARLTSQDTATGSLNDPRAVCGFSTAEALKANAIADASSWAVSFRAIKALICRAVMDNDTRSFQSSEG